MQKELYIEFENENISSRKVGSILVLELKREAFHLIIDLDESFEMLDWFNLISKDKGIKGLLIIGDQNAYCDEAYAQYLSEVTGEKILPDKKHAIKSFKEKNKREIEINMLNNFTRMFIENPKIIIAAMSGCVASPFWGLSLVADLRIAAENTEFHLSDKLYDLYPSGALPFFLKKHIGLSKTQEIIFTKDKITAAEARSLGLLNGLVSKDNFKSDSISYANKILEYDYEYFKNAKILIQHSLLEEYNRYQDKTLIMI